MENRDAIIRKLNALKAKANNAGTPEEAVVFMNGYNKLMAKYRMTESDLEVKNSTVEGFVKKTPKTITEMEKIVTLIAELTETRAVSDGIGSIAFIGLRVDLEYAQWIYDLIANSLQTALHALPLTMEYHAAINRGGKTEQIKDNFKAGFLIVIIHALREMIKENKKAGNAVVLVKKDLIQAFVDEKGGTAKGRKTSIKIYTGEEEFAYKGAEEGMKVKLRKGVDSEIKGYLK